MSPDLVLFVLLAGWGLGLLTALVAHWAAAKLAGEPMRTPRDPALAGLEVRDSSMGEFDAAVRRSS